ncbi:hypothetical protein Cgig2_021698 [Carnegiea gigantea]|uniref:Pentatricopeptide repeat-containing protein n=1 Tax=Carnegiea gigantea TaxID=171969 RepID=A0A9Q1QPD4_9CARY|nr:hypothetical protein Cgig2_021698 [Carnegiea gigantea]
MRKAVRKLSVPQSKHLQSTPPLVNPALAPVSESFPTPLPTVCLSSSTTQTQLLIFLKAHLKPPITPQILLHFLKNKLHYHPKFTHLDFHIFQWATTIDLYRHDHHIYEWMIRTLAVTDRFDALRTILLECVPSKPCPCSDGIFCCPRIEPIYRFAINSYCRIGSLDDALLAFNTVQRLIDGRPNVALYNILIHGFVKNGQHDKALNLYDRLIMDRVKPDIFTFNIVISSYCRNSNFRSALELFKEMRAKGCEPNACELLIDFARKKALPDGFDCSYLIERLCSESNVGRALEIVEEMWKAGTAPSLIACSTLVECLRKVGNVEEALRLVDKMLKEDILLDNASHSGRTAEADKLRLLASSKGLDPDVMTDNILVDGYTREGRRKEGERLVEEMLDKDCIPDIASYNRLMDGLRNYRNSAGC